MRRETEAERKERREREREASEAFNRTLRERVAASKPRLADPERREGGDDAP